MGRPAAGLAPEQDLASPPERAGGYSSRHDAQAHRVVEPVAACGDVRGAEAAILRRGGTRGAIDDIRHSRQQDLSAEHHPDDEGAGEVGKAVDHQPVRSDAPQQEAPAHVARELHAEGDRVVIHVDIDTMPLGDDGMGFDGRSARKTWERIPSFAEARLGVDQRAAARDESLLAAKLAHLRKIGDVFVARFRVRLVDILGIVGVP
mmetsp:Transcript_23011/g.44878  ORF Transcript_23011/g.44878 Transcript_23011/m.44878 type:complete len:205 (+) Transcript_23011:702-1316(+)